MIGKQDGFFIHYKYDALDRVASLGQPARSKCQRFYCESRLATETQGEERHSVVQHGDQLLAQQQQKDGRFENTLLATDSQRSVLSTLTSYNPHSTAYSPYGHRPFGIGLSSLLGFNGHLPDPVTGHYLLGNGYRAFNPILMRFDSPDNLSPFGGGGVNTYAYCLGDPINRSDPTGHVVSARGSHLSRVSAQAKSFEVGIKLKPVTNVTRLSEGIFTFEDRGGSRLTFEAHGIPGGLTEGLNALELVGLAKRHSIQVKSFESVRLVVCHSADIEKNSFGVADISFAESLNKLVKLPVKGYEGKVVSVDTRRVFEGLGVGETYAGPYYFGVVKKGSAVKRFGAQFSPVVFDKVKRPVSRVRT